MQSGLIVFRCRAALDEVQIGVILDDDERMLKLSRALCVEPEVGLQRDLQPHARRHIDKRSARPDRAVQRRKFVIGRRNELHEMRPDHLRKARIMHRAFEIGVDNAGFRDLPADIVIDQLGVILRADARQRFALCLRDAEPLEGLLDILRHIVPVGVHAGFRADICDNIVQIQSVNRRSPRRHFCFREDLQRMQTELPHPFRIALFF